LASYLALIEQLSGVATLNTERFMNHKKNANLFAGLAFSLNLKKWITSCVQFESEPLWGQSRFLEILEEGVGEGALNRCCSNRMKK
jgi:hypothetical protein